jgi:hypothetical protein
LKKNGEFRLAHGIFEPGVQKSTVVQHDSKKRHPKGCLFLLLRLIFCAFPRENHPLTNPIKRFILIAIKKAVTKKKLFFRGQREGRPRLKAPRQGHGLYHFRAACDEQDGYRPLQRSKATAYAGSLPPILRCRSLKYRPYSCAPAPCLDERYPAIRSGQ